MERDTLPIGLLTTSAKTDVLQSKGKLEITGLKPMRREDILDVSIKNYRAEQVQVVTIGGTAPTIVAGEFYIIGFYGVEESEEGHNRPGKQYKTKRDNLTGTAADDRQLIYDALANQINSDKDNNMTANAGSGGTGMTITDNAGYFKGARRGKSRLQLDKDSTGGGFTHSTHFAITTAAIYARGVGADLLLQNPNYDTVTGNLNQGIDEGENLANAVSGQQYDLYSFSSLVKANISVMEASAVYKMMNQYIYVDNGLGSSTANAAGSAAFLKEIERIAYSLYSEDPNAIVSLLDQPVLMGAKSPAGAPTGTTGDENVVDLGGGARLGHHVLGTQTIVGLSWTTTGLDLVQDVADNDGCELSGGVEAADPHSFVVGQQDFSFRASISVADITDLNPFNVGFRKKEAYQAAVDNYDEMASFGVNSAADETGATKNIDILTIKNNTATVATDSTVDWADGEERVFEVQVFRDGSVKFFIDDVECTSEQSTAFTFDVGEEVIPFIYHLNEGSADPGTELRKFFAIPGILNRLD